MQGAPVGGLHGGREQPPAVFYLEGADVGIPLLQAVDECLPMGLGVCRTAAAAHPAVVHTQGVGGILAEARVVSGRLVNARQCVAESFVNL